MNETINNLVNRRSVRSYQNKQIDEEALQQILQAGLYAPSGMGRQPTIMVVIQDEATIKEVSRLNGAVMNSDSDPFYGAPTVIVVLADSTVPTYREDGSLVMGNLMNAAHSLGIGSCWIHRAKEEFETEIGKEFLKQWGIPDNYVGIGHCILGYPDGNLPEAKPRKEDYVRYIRD